jgi:uncharacterized membrane protein YciS (DUF1049 family)
MKSYFLGIVVAIALSAVYVTYNTAEITVNYLGFQATFNQGIWDVFLFGAGAIIMWVLSLAASFETYTANKKRTQELNKKIEELENEKKSLLSALENIGRPNAARNAEKAIAEAKTAFQTLETAPPRETAAIKYIPVQTVPEETTEEDSVLEETTSEENRPSSAKNLLASIFKNNKESEPEETYSGKTETDETSESYDKAEVSAETTAEEIIETDEKTEADDVQDDIPHVAVCELDLDEEKPTEDENDSGEKQDRGIFTV